MEKEILRNGPTRRILITGPESTGKTELALWLTERFKGTCIPEYAREYIENLNGPYKSADLEIIARKQIEEYEHVEATGGWVFFDTWLIITRVWFDVVYGRIPDWINEGIRRSRFDLVLLCAPDIPWIADPVRENGGENRALLFDRYKKELNAFGLDWKLVTGSGNERVLKALQLIQKAFYDDPS